MFPLLGCWPSHVLNSSSRLNKTFKASVMTYDGVESMNSAYRSSCTFTDSSTRAWIVTVFACLGGALMIGICPFCSSLSVLYYELSYNSVAAPPPRGQNTGCDFLSSLRRAGPPKPARARPRFCGAVGALPPLPVFSPRAPSCPRLTHLLTSPHVYL